MRTSGTKDKPNSITLVPTGTQLTWTISTKRIAQAQLLKDLTGLSSRILIESCFSTPRNNPQNNGAAEQNGVPDFCSVPSLHAVLSQCVLSFHWKLRNIIQRTMSSFDTRSSMIHVCREGKGLSTLFTRNECIICRLRSRRWRLKLEYGICCRCLLRFERITGML